MEWKLHTSQYFKIDQVSTNCKTCRERYSSLWLMCAVDFIYCWSHDCPLDIWPPNAGLHQALVLGYWVGPPPWLLVIGVSRAMLMAGGFRSKACIRLYGQILNNNHCTTYSLCETKSTFNWIKSLHNWSERKLIK